MSRILVHQKLSSQFVLNSSSPISYRFLTILIHGVKNDLSCDDYETEILVTFLVTEF